MNETKLDILKLLLECDSKTQINNNEENLGDNEENLGKHIVVLQRGHVVIGDLSKKGNYFYLKDGSIIRRWGTTDGLGEIAINGPTSSTTLDKIPASSFHELTTILLMKCEKQP